MFSNLTLKQINLFARFYIPIVMLIHLHALIFYVSVSEAGYIDLYKTLLGSFFQDNFHYFYVLYCSIGIFYFIRPKVLLPLCLILCGIIQGTLYNILMWHDQQVSFYLLTTLTIFYLKPSFFKRISIRKLVLLFIALQFFGAFVSKVSNSGLSWANGENLQYWLVYYHIFFDIPLALKLANYIDLCRLGSSLVLFFQFTFPLCLFFEKLQKLYVFSTLVFVISVYIFMKIDLLFLCPVLLIFLPWEKIEKSLQSKFRISFSFEGYDC